MEAQARRADADHVQVAQRAPPLHALLVDERPVGRAPVVEHGPDAVDRTRSTRAMRDTCASQGSAIPPAGERPTVTRSPASGTSCCTPSPSRSSTNGASARSAASRACSSVGVERVTFGQSCTTRSLYGARRRDAKWCLTRRGEPDHPGDEKVHPSRGWFAPRPSGRVQPWPPPP